MQTGSAASLTPQEMKESSSPVSKSCSTRSEKGKASIVAARSLCVETPLTKLLMLILVYTLQTSSATSLTGLEMKETPSPVNKRSSTGSVKGKVSIVAARSLCVETPLTKLLMLILVYRLGQVPP